MIPEIQNIIFDYINPARYSFQKVIQQLKMIADRNCTTCCRPFHLAKRHVLCTYKCKCNLTFCSVCFWEHEEKYNHVGYIKEFYINNSFDMFESFL